jgi:hypothetical protein
MVGELALKFEWATVISSQLSSFLGICDGDIPRCFSLARKVRFPIPAGPICVLLLETKGHRWVVDGQNVLDG